MNQSDGSDGLDREAVDRVLKGDSDAFAGIVSRYQGKIFGMGMRFFRNRHAAEDFVQEAFLRVFQKLPTYRGEARFYSWMMRVAYNLAVDTLGGSRNEESVDNYELPDDRRWFDPERRTLIASAFEAVRDAIRRLPPAHAVCVDLYFFFHLRYREISEITGLPINTVKSNVFRAKARLREELERTSAEGIDGLQ